MHDFPESTEPEPVIEEPERKPGPDPLRVLCMLDHGQLAVFGAAVRPIVSANALPVLDEAEQVR